MITGEVTIKVNGKLLRSKPGAKLDSGGMERTTIMVNRRADYSEKAVPAKIEATLAHTADTDIDEINGFVAATAIFECDTGIAYMVKGAHTSKPCQLTGGEGDLSFEMEGEAAVKV